MAQLSIAKDAGEHKHRSTTLAPGSMNPPAHMLAPTSAVERSKSFALRVPDASADKQDQEVPVKACLGPKELYFQIVETGVIKSQWRWDKQLALGLIAAFYIGFSFTAMMVVGGQIPGLQHGDNPGLYTLLLGCFGFPLGLFMICVVGADLFTSDCSYMMTAYWEGRIRWWDIARSWIVSWWVNLAGSIIMALIVFLAMVFYGRSDFALALTLKKTSFTFGACLCKAILANWLVNLAVWIANSSQDITGKAIGIFLPVSAFIAIGGEHCIANQFLFALAKLLGSDVSVGTMITKNLIPATTGNIIGGAFFVGTMYGFAVGTLYDTTYKHITTGCGACCSPRASTYSEVEAQVDDNANGKAYEAPSGTHSLNSVLTRFKTQGVGDGVHTSSSMLGLVAYGQHESMHKQHTSSSNSSNPPHPGQVYVTGRNVMPQNV